MSRFAGLNFNAPTPHGVVIGLMLAIVLLVLTQPLRSFTLYEAGLVVLFYTTLLAIKVANAYDARTQ
jgi:hypothetical protein